MSTDTPAFNRDAMRYLVEEIAPQAARVVRLEDGRELVIRPDSWSVQNPPKPSPTPLALAVNLSSLTSLVAFVAANLDSLKTAEHYLHVASPTKVHMLGPIIGPLREREIPAVVSLDARSYNFGAWSMPDDFNTELLALFAPPDGTEDANNQRDEVLAMTSKIRRGSEFHTIDSGRSQSVAVTEGIDTLAEEKVPNPVMLRPYRTFREVTQPASPFILRLKEGPNGAVMISLHEADGGAWRLEAARHVAEYLAAAMEENQVAAELRPKIIH